jgi:murein DD-endopeptidase MepM/ murein hydrolase activator NlpD
MVAPPFFVTRPVVANADPALGAVVFPIMAPRLSSGYGSRKHPVFKSVRHHNGVDLAAPENSHVRAILPGVVIFADTHGGYGKLVTVKHKNGYSSLYGHLSEIRVNPGERIKAGDIIGRVGTTGKVTGPHLHFEWRKNGEPIDPLKVFPALAADAEG